MPYDSISITEYTMTIIIDNIEELAEIVAGLVREGLTFEARRDKSHWTITLLGGH